MHGNNLNSLHQLIHPEILPSELGGMMPPYDMGTWARTLLDHAYDEETDYCPESYTLSVQDLERDLEKNLSPKTMKRSDHRLTVFWVLKTLHAYWRKKTDFLGFPTKTFFQILQKFECFLILFAFFLL